MTAIEWLANRLPKIDFEDDPYYRGLFNIAIELEKRQIENAFCDGVDDEYEHHINNKIRKNSEQYYNETFKKINHEQ